MIARATINKKKGAFLSISVLLIIPVRLPCVQYLWILDAEFGGLKVEEVKETLDCLGQGAALGHRKDRVKHGIDVRLKDALWREREE